MGKELEGQLAIPLEGVGEGRVDGSTWHLVNQQKAMWAKVLSKVLTLHRTRQRSQCGSSYKWTR